MQNNIAGYRQRWNKAKPTKALTFWIVIGAIIVAVILGFTRGGWVTGGTAVHRAEVSAQGAVLERLTPICVAQFGQDPQKDQKLAELKSLNSSRQRALFVTDQGWATMPGEAQPDSKVAAECTKQLMLIVE